MRQNFTYENEDFGVYVSVLSSLKDLDPEDCNLIKERIWYYQEVDGEFIDGWSNPNLSDEANWLLSYKRSSNMFILYIREDAIDSAIIYTEDEKRNIFLQDAILDIRQLFIEKEEQLRLAKEQAEYLHQLDEEEQVFYKALETSQEEYYHRHWFWKLVQKDIERTSKHSQNKHKSPSQNLRNRLSIKERCIQSLKKEEFQRV